MNVQLTTKWDRRGLSGEGKGIVGTTWAIIDHTSQRMQLHYFEGKSI